MRLDIVIPTLNRAEKLGRCISSILDSEGIQHIDLRIIVMHDSRRRQAFGCWNEYFADGMQANAMAYVCDDVTFRPKAIAEACRVMWEAFGGDYGGVVGLNQENIEDGGEGFSRSAMGLIGRGFAARYKWEGCQKPVFCPDYRSFHADAELGLFARKMGCFRYAENAKIHHYHPVHHKEEMDETHRLVRNKEVVARDRATWDQRKANGWLWGEKFDLLNA